jgi:glycosyltransferase involved in cell wall biosynthesis
VQERTRAGRVAALIAVSEMVRRQYLAGVPGFPAQRLVTIPNGVDELRIAQVDRALARAALGLRDEFLFVSLARYGLQKNTYALVTAFAEVAARHPDAHLLVAGRADDPAYFAQVADHARRQECASRIHLRGHCTNPSALLAAADAFVLDSFFEGWSLASMEALVLGVPVVMADVGGAREQLAAEGWGHLVANPAHHPESVDWDTIAMLRFRPQDNRAELVDAMSQVVREADLWIARREDLARQARSAFPAGLCLRRHAEVLRAVASGAPIPHFLSVATLES